MAEDLNENMVCYKHPDRQTLLRCNQCGRPICPECAVKVPTGYRCKECVREQQKRFDTSETKDYFIGGAIAFVIGLVGSYISRLIPYVPTIITALVLGTLCGRLVCRLVRAAVNKRRSRTLTLIMVIAAAIGALLPQLTEIVINLNLMFAGPAWVLNGVMQIILDLLFAAAIGGTIWMEMNGMVFRD